MRPCLRRLCAGGLLLLWLVAGCGPRSEEDYFRRAAVHFAKGRFAQAVQVYRDYLQAFPDGRWRDKALFKSGEIQYYALNQRGAAVLSFGRLVQEYPQSDFSIRAREILAQAYRDEIHDYRNAVLEYRWLLSQRPESPRAAWYQFQVAHCYFLANDFERSIQEYRSFLERYPHSSLMERAYDELGSANMILGRPERARAVFEEMIARYPESPLRPTVEFKIGNCLEETGRLQEALAQYQDVLDRYENQRAVQIRIQGVQARLKNRLGEATPVNYDYRPARRSRARAKDQVNIRGVHGQVRSQKKKAREGGGP